jgi:hypothetical protein
LAAPGNTLFVVTREPAPLAGMAFPGADTDWPELHRLGFRRVVRLHHGAYDPSPLVADEIVLEDLFGGRAPSDPAAERERVLRAAELVAAHVRAGEGVVVHCVGGTGRTGTVIACALRRLGLAEDEAVRAVQAHRPNWPESPWQAEVVRSGAT